MGLGAERGEIIAGYVLTATLGEGSTSRVFVARHQETGQQAAIKVLAPSVMESAEARARVVQEARTASELRHPHIAEIWDLHETTNPPRIALVMELVEGPSMRMLRGSPVGSRRARTLARQLVSAVAAAHGAAVIHRDLKPDNILFKVDPRFAMEPELHLKVVDFGLAKRLGPGSAFETKAGTMLGTPAYMAPEQIMGRVPPTPATDIYAVAELVYELFTGERVFPKDSSQLVLQQKLRGDIPELPMPAPLDQSLVPVLEACLNPNPRHRPALEALDRALKGLSERALCIPAGATVVSAPPTGALARARSEDSEPSLPRRPARATVEAGVATDAVSADNVREALERLSPVDWSSGDAQPPLPFVPRVESFAEPAKADEPEDETTQIEEGASTDPVELASHFSEESTADYSVDEGMGAPASVALNDAVHTSTVRRGGLAGPEDTAEVSVVPSFADRTPLRAGFESGRGDSQPRKPRTQPSPAVRSIFDPPARAWPSGRERARRRAWIWLSAVVAAVVALGGMLFIMD